MKNFYRLIRSGALLVIVSANTFASNNVLKIKIAGGSFSDETIIRFHSEATNGFDSNYDAWKLFSSNVSAPSIFTKDSLSDLLAINAMPELNASVTTDVYMKIGAAGIYSISASELGAFDTEIKITLKDVITNKIYDLRTNSTYTISLPAIAETDPAHFQVLFSYPSSFPNSVFAYSPEISALSVFPSPATSLITISLDNSKDSETLIRITDMLGRECFSRKITPASDHENITINIDSTFIPGIYSVTAISNEKVFEQKIIIN